MNVSETSQTPQQNPLSDPSLGETFPRLHARAFYYDAYGKHGQEWGRVYGTVTGFSPHSVELTLDSGKREYLPRTHVNEVLYQEDAA